MIAGFDPITGKPLQLFLNGTSVSQPMNYFNPKVAINPPIVRIRKFVFSALRVVHSIL